MDDVIPKTVDVRGMKPVTQGSMSAFGPGVLTDTHSKKLKPWRKAIQEAYVRDCGIFYEQHTPVAVFAFFYFKRPKKPVADAPSTKGADLDKLARGLGDALTGYAYFDDCQIVEWCVSKAYVDTEEEEGVQFQVLGKNKFNGELVK